MSYWNQNIEPHSEFAEILRKYLNSEQQLALMMGEGSNYDRARAAFAGIWAIVDKITSELPSMTGAEQREYLFNCIISGYFGIAQRWGIDPYDLRNY